MSKKMILSNADMEFARKMFEWSLDDPGVASFNVQYGEEKDSFIVDVYHDEIGEISFQKRNAMTLADSARRELVAEAITYPDNEDGVERILGYFFSETFEEACAKIGKMSRGK